MIIGIKGGLKVGKDEVTNMIIELLSSKGIKPKNKKFADKLKDIVCLLINCSKEQLEDRKFKTKPIGPDWVIYKVVGDYDYITKDMLFPTLNDAENYVATNWKGFEKSIAITKEELTPRKLLQLIGTEGARNIIHPNIWCSALFSEYTDKSNWVISDVRFPNEKEIIEKNGGIIIEIKRPFELRFPQYSYLTIDSDSEYDTIEKLKEVDLNLYDTLTHSSETALDYVKFSHTIVNSNSLLDLKNEVFKILNSVNIY